MIYPLAVGQAVRNRSQDEDYILRDGFAGTLAAGAVNGSWSQDGRGVRGVLDGNSKLSIGSGVASFATGGVANFDPALVYQNQFNRVPGLVMLATLTLTSGRCQFGWLAGTDLVAATINGNRRGSFDFNSTTLAIAPTTTGSITVGAIATATAYQCALAQRNIGMMYLIKGGSFTNWTLLWVDEVGTSPLLNPFVAAMSTTGVFTVDQVAVPALHRLYLPDPLVSDGFSSWGSSDGLGHQEGLNGRLGSGGNGKTWTANVGSWGASGGVAAATALTGGRAIATVDSGKADLIITVNCTLSSGTMSLIVRWVDENNHVRVTLTSTNCQLVKVVAGTPTTVSDVAYTYSAGAELRIVCQGSEFRRFYNNAAVGAAFTIADAALQSPTVVGLRTDNTGNTFDNLNAYARGSGGEYAALDSY